MLVIFFRSCVIRASQDLDLRVSNLLFDWEKATIEPISILPLYEVTFACGNEYAFFNKLACFFQADSSVLEGFYPLNQRNPQTGLTGIQRMANWWFVLHLIIEGCINDPIVTGSWFQRHFFSRNLEKLRNKLVTIYKGKTSELRFVMMKFWTIMTAAENTLSISNSFQDQKIFLRQSSISTLRRFLAKQPYVYATEYLRSCVVEPSNWWASTWNQCLSWFRSCAGFVVWAGNSWWKQ